MENPIFLKNKYNLHNSPEAESAVKRTEKATDKKVSQKPEERIQNYLDRFNEIIKREDPEKRSRGIEALKKVLHDKFILREDEVPESYYGKQREIAREQGHGDIEITEEMKKELAEVIISDQESTMDNWIDYLSSDDATYPDWLKYYAFRSMLNLGKYDKERKKFPPRELPDHSESGKKKENLTTAPFSDLNREALAYVLDAIEKKYSGIKTITTIGEEDDSEEYEKFQKYLQGENFAKLYAWAIEKVTPASQESLETVKGKWIKYDQGSYHMPLVKSLQGHGTGWCTAGESTARTQLQSGDFYVFYSEDEKGNPSIPRVAIRMEEQGKIAEVRGIAQEQNLDSHIGDTVKEKLGEFGEEGKAYEKKAEDMKRLTEIEKKTKNDQELTKEDLIFLYEIDNSIEGFGYQRDPRIDEIRKIRNVERDASIFFECNSDQIAKNIEDVNENTKAYIGEWSPKIFQKIRNYPNIKHLYESFPDKMIFMRTLETDPNIDSSEKVEKALKDKNIYLSNWGKDILYKTEFSQKSKSYDLVRFTVENLGFPSNATTEEIYNKAEKLGLELCPAEVGPHLRLKYPEKERMLIAMKQIRDRDGDSDVFDLGTGGDQLYLDGFSARPDYRWRVGNEFVFRFRKLET